MTEQKIIEDNKTEYYLALRKSQKTLDGENENIIIWLEYFLKILEIQAVLAIDLLSTEKIESLLSPKQILVWDYLSKISETTAGEIVKKTGVLRPTVNQSLDRLLKMKKIQRIGMGRTTRYKIIGK